MAITVQDDLGLVLDAARVLHANGERTAVTEALTAELASHLGLSVRLELSWSAVTVHLLVEGATTDTRRAPASPVTVNMARVRAVHGAIAATMSGQLDRQGLTAALGKAAGLPTAPLWLFVCACISGAVALAVIFGAHRPEAFACFAVSAAAGGFLRRRLGGRGMAQPGQVFTAALLAGLVGALAAHAGISSDQRLVAIAPCMILVPGPHILNGCLDLIHQRIPLGVARLVLAGTILAGITVGVLGGLLLGGSSLPPSAEAVDVPLLVDVAAAAVASSSYAVYFSAPASLIVWPVLVGATGHGLRWLAIDHLGAPPAVGAGIACLFAGVVLVPICRRLHIPFTAIGFASVVALIPSVYLYRAAAGAVDLLTATGTSLTALVGEVTKDLATAVTIIVAMIVGLALPVAATDHLKRASRSAESGVSGRHTRTSEDPPE
jgi:uncharacterized membrane protein YjjP (DUF1212 family)